MEEEIRILCVDDEPNVLNSIRRLFLDYEYTILTATSAQEGLEILQNARIQIVMSDYRMPNMNGVEFLKEVRKFWPETVRIVLSGYADTAAIVSAVNEGQIYKFIPKPWNDDDLKATIANAIEGYYLFKRRAELTDQLIKVNEELKELLEDKSKILELKGEMLEASQMILFSLPIAVLGISEDIIVQCNEAWTEDTGNRWDVLGKSVESALPPDVAEFVQEVKVSGKTKKRTTMNGVTGHLFGSVIPGDDKEPRGVILAFIRGDSI
jgi:two-component system NtrC family sensor kinase